MRDCPGGGDESPLPELRAEGVQQPASLAYAHNWSLVHNEKSCLVKRDKLDSTRVLLPIIILVFLAAFLLAVYLVNYFSYGFLRHIINQFSLGGEGDVNDKPKTGFGCMWKVAIPERD